MNISRRNFTVGAALLGPSLISSKSAIAAIIPNVVELNLDKTTVVFSGGVYYDLSPFTTHTFQIRANLPLNLAQYAFWRLVWTAPAPQPGFETGIVRLYTQVPDSSGPKTPIAYVHSSTMLNPGTNNVSNDAVDITSALNSFILSGASGHIGWDISGDNSSPLTFYSSRLEIGWHDQ